MQSRRGGRVGVNYLQFAELVERVEKLEAKANNDNIGLEATEESELTKSDIKEMLDHREISYTTKHTKDDLLALLNKEENENA